MAKILIIVDDYLPGSVRIAGKMMHELSCEFLRKGYEVTVIVPNMQIKSRASKTSLDGVNILYFRSGQIKSVPLLKRGLNESMLSLRAWKAYKKFFLLNKHDAIVYYSPSIFWGGLVKKLKQIWQCRSYLILRDLFPQWIIDNGIIKDNTPISFYLKYHEKLNYKSADCIGLMSPKNLNWFCENQSYDGETEVLYNWSKKKDIPVSNKFRNKLGLKDKIIFFYGGNLGQAQDMKNLINLAINMSSYKNAHFLFVGEGDQENLIKEAAVINNNITYMPPLNQDEYLQLLTECDIGLFSLAKEFRTHNFPGKLLSYFAHEKAVLGSLNQDNDLFELLESRESGLLSINGDDESFKNNAILLLENKEKRLTAANNGTKLLIELFSVESAANKILDFFNLKYVSQERSL